jgi:PAS domain S-box-containing protein
MENFMRIKNHFLLILLLVLAVSRVICPGSVLSGEQSPSVLVVHSYHPELGWTGNINSAVLSQLKKVRPGIDVQIEYLDAKRYVESFYYDHTLKELYRYKLKGRRYSAVLVSDNRALDFVLGIRQELLPGVPVVFCGVNNFEESMLQGQQGITGVAEQPAYFETLQTALRLHPATRKVVVVGNKKTTTGRLILQQLETLPDRVSPELQFVFWNDVPLEDLQSRLQGLDADSLVLLSVVVRDAAGQPLTFAGSSEALRAVCPVPIYGFWDFFLDHGIVGGKLVSATDQGRLAAGLLLRILDGTPADELPVITAGANQYMFDYRELARFGRTLQELPPGSQVVNRPSKFYSIEKRYLLLGGGGLALLTIISLLLLWNIHSRHRVQEELEHALAEAEEARDSVDIILKSVTEGLIVTDMNQRITRMNCAAEKLLGVTFEQVQGQAVRSVLPQDGLPGPWLQPGRRPRQQIEWEVLEPRTRKPLVIQARTGYVQSTTGQRSGTISILRDVTREREIDRFKNEFIATAAHELRTPLTAVMGFADILLQQERLGGFDAGQQRHYLEVIFQKADALRRIIGDLLDISRVQLGQSVALEKRPCDVCDLVQRTVIPFRQVQVGYCFELDLPEEPVGMNLDEGKVLQVLDNVLSNAVKFSPDGGRISVKGYQLGPEFRVSVEDQGIGMSSEQLERIFDKFFRVDASNSAADGLGLGMTIAKNIVEAHGGQIMVESCVGQGTKVSFSLMEEGAMEAFL